MVDDYDKLFKGKDIMLKGHQLHSRIGVGTIYFVHGLSARWPDYKPLLEPLAETFDVRAYDQRGHGKSPGKYNYLRAADDLESIIEDEGRNLVGILGHSIGCRTAVDVAKRFESKGKPFAGIYLLEPCLGIDSFSSPKREQLQSLRKYAQLLLPVDFLLNMMPFVRKQLGFNQRYVIQTTGALAGIDSYDCSGIAKTPVGYMLAGKDSVLGTDDPQHFLYSMKRMRELFSGEFKSINGGSALDDSGAVPELNHCFNYKGHQPFMKDELDKDANIINHKIANFFYTVFAKS
jgi:pimeloyl-ACP methyl ester carboxylesterase